jgi:hypothetical protein
MAAYYSVGSDQEIGKNPSGTLRELPSSTRSIFLKGAPRYTPNSLIEIPVDHETGVSQEGINEGLTSPRRRHQLR